MSTDRLLGTLLRTLQTHTDQQDTPRLLGAASTLLVTLHNPLNVTLLTSHLLSAPAIWAGPENLRICAQSILLFQTAVQALLEKDVELEAHHADKRTGVVPEKPLPRDDWIRAVVHGANDNSPRWRHLLVLGGLLSGVATYKRLKVPPSVRTSIEKGVVAATNAALDELSTDDEFARQALTLALNHAFPFLSDAERSRLDYDRLLPLLMYTTFHAGGGLRSGYFVSAIDMDVQAVSHNRFRWPERSPSFQQLRTILASPLVTSLGLLARLIAHAIEQVHEPWLVTAALDDLGNFARTLHLQWRQTKLSEIDTSEEQLYLDTETLQKTHSAVWNFLRSILFATVIPIRSVLGRLLGDKALAQDQNAPLIATQVLSALRHLYFISARHGSEALTQHTFAYLTAIDVLAAYPSEAQAFLQSIKPAEPGQIPSHPMERYLDLFFLNTAEHLTLILPSEVAEELLVSAVTPYIGATESRHLLPLFEAAHSLMLAVFSAPQNVDLTMKHLPFYVSALFESFPTNISARQFRSAFKTLMTTCTPPSALAALQPMLPAILLDLLHERAIDASTELLLTSDEAQAISDPRLPVTEQAVLVMTIIDTFSQLPPDLLEEWLSLTAALVNSIHAAPMRKHCIEHFWHVLTNGAMDPNRSQMCAAWWSTRGGREALLHRSISPQEDVTYMSGALPDANPSSKL